MEALVGSALGAGISSIFGKSAFGGSSSKGQSSSQSVDMTPEAFKGIQPDIAAALQKLLQPGGIPVQPGPGTDITNPTANMQATLNNLQSTAGTPGSNPAWATINDTLSGAYLPGQGKSNPYLEAAIEAAQRPTASALNDTLSRTLPGTFTAAGQTIGGGLRSPNANLKAGSTAFDMAAARAFEGGSRALSDIATNMSFQGYNTERGLQSAAINQALTAGQQDIQALVQNLEAQAVPINLKKYGYEQGIARSNEQINQLLQALSIGAGVGRPTVGQQSQSTQSSETAGNSFSALFPKGV